MAKTTTKQEPQPMSPTVYATCEALAKDFAKSGKIGIDLDAEMKLLGWSKTRCAVTRQLFNIEIENVISEEA